MKFEEVKQQVDDLRENIGSEVSWDELVEHCPDFIKHLERNELYEILHSLQNDGTITI